MSEKEAVSSKIKKFPKLKTYFPVELDEDYFLNPEATAFYEEFIEKTLKWRVKATETLEKLLEDARKEQKRIKVEEPENHIAWNYWEGYRRATKEVLESLK